MLGFASGGTSSVRTSIHTCNSLLEELQQIWKEIGESEADKERMLLELEMECLQVYQRKVDEATKIKARLNQTVLAKEAEFATLMATLGELNINSPIKSEKTVKSLKEQLVLVSPLVENLRKKQEERIKQFTEIKSQIEKITGEISGFSHVINAINLEEQEDISLRKLSEYQSHLHVLQKERAIRIQKVMEYVNEVHSLCGVLGLDFGKVISEVHPSLNKTGVEQSTNISDTTLDGLNQAINKLKIERKVRFLKVKEVCFLLFELWNLMDTSEEERNEFFKVTSILECSELDIIQPNALSLDIIQQATEEVERLTKLKASRMKELVMKRRVELEEICYKTHIQPDLSTASDKANAMIDSGLVDPSELLSNIEGQIRKVKDEALSRKEIMDRIERWLSACDEENWLEDYSQDDSRYSAGRGVHINLKRAEKARITVTKIPVMVDSLIHKTVTWENEKNKSFLYDGVRLVSILEDYKLARQQKEEEKKRARDQKKLQDMLLAEKESMYGSKPSPRKSSSFRKVNGYRVNGNGSVTPSPRRNSVNSEVSTPRSYSGGQNGHFKEMRRLSTAPLNFVAITKEDTMSYSSAWGSEPESPPQA